MRMHPDDQSDAGTRSQQKHAETTDFKRRGVPIVKRRHVDATDSDHLAQPALTATSVSAQPTAVTASSRPLSSPRRI